MEKECGMLLAVKPEFAFRILSGEKRYEFRKARPSRPVEKVFVYATRPVGKVIGEATLETVLSGSPGEIWERCGREGGIDEDRFFEYYGGHGSAFAYRLGSVRAYGEPKELGDFGLSRAPQSFAYVRPEEQEGD